jgi:hypothetical protein
MPASRNKTDARLTGVPPSPLRLSEPASRLPFIKPTPDRTVLQVLASEPLGRMPPNADTVFQAAYKNQILHGKPGSSTSHDINRVAKAIWATSLTEEEKMLWSGITLKAVNQWNDLTRKLSESRPTASLQPAPSVSLKRQRVPKFRPVPDRRTLELIPKSHDITAFRIFEIAYEFQFSKTSDAKSVPREQLKEMIMREWKMMEMVDRAPWCALQRELLDGSRSSHRLHAVGSSQQQTHHSRHNFEHMQAPRQSTIAPTSYPHSQSPEPDKRRNVATGPYASAGVDPRYNHSGPPQDSTPSIYQRGGYSAQSLSAPVHEFPDVEGWMNMHLSIVNHRS